MKRDGTRRDSERRGGGARAVLVDATAERLRALVLSCDPDSLLGSQRALAEQLGVGLVTLQQAARVLEHEGLLAVRRGAGGGFYGLRPDSAALERAVSAYLRYRVADPYEALEMKTLLDCEIIPAAARCRDEGLFAALEALKLRIDHARAGDDRVAFEEDFHAILFRMIDKPLLELMGRVSMRFYSQLVIPPIYGDDGFEAWRTWRHRTFAAILARDPGLAEFETRRHRRFLLQRLRDSGVGLAAAEDGDMDAVREHPERGD